VERIAPHSSAADRSRLEQEFKRREAETILQSGELFEGVEDMLRELKNAGHVLAICGMGSEEHIDAVLKRCNIGSYFNYVYSNRQGKTKTELLAQLICDSGQRKENCVMIGDSITDLTAAKDNCIPFIGVSYGYGTDGIKGCVMVNDMEELKGLLNQYANN
jgi:phosphoglycolate phosphatase